MNLQTEIRFPTVYIALFFTLVSATLYFVFVGHPIWETNDDVGMNLIASGVWFANEPSMDLYFIHPYMGWVLSSLYRVAPDIPWYGASFVAILVLSVFVLNSAIIRLQKKTIENLGLNLCLSVISLNVFLSYLQFTSVAGIAVLAGFSAFVSLEITPTRVKRRGLLFLSLGFMLATTGFLIREDSFKLVMLICLPVYLYYRIKEKKLFLVSSLPDLKRLAIWMSLVTVFFLALSFGARDHFDREGWRNWVSLNKAKAEFIDYSRVKYSAETADAFAAVGWTPTDYRMIMSWQYTDSERYSSDKFWQVIELARAQESTLPDPISQRWQVKSELALLHIQRAFYSSKAIFICFGVFLLLAFHANPKATVLVLGVVLSIVAYLSIGLNRLPARVIFVILGSACWIFLAILYRAKISSLSWSFNFYKLALHRFAIILLIATAYQGNSIARERSRLYVDSHNLLVNIIEGWQEKLPKDAVIYSPGSSFLYTIAVLPLKPFSYLRSVSSYIGTGTANQSPLFNRQVSSLGLEGSFFNKLASLENVYLINSRANPYYYVPLAQHYREVYGKHIQFEKSGITGLTKVTFGDLTR